jgi:hypothetical protein
MNATTRKKEPAPSLTQLKPAKIVRFMFI